MQFFKTFFSNLNRDGILIKKTGNILFRWQVETYDAIYH